MYLCYCYAVAMSFYLPYRMLNICFFLIYFYFRRNIINNGMKSIDVWSMLFLRNYAGDCDFYRTLT